MPRRILAAGEEWFQKIDLAPGLTLFTEPFVHEIFAANAYHCVGRDCDLIVDFGMGLASLKAAMALRPGKPVLAVATHVHADHVGSFHEFHERAGPRLEVDAFAMMDDRHTFADEFRMLDAPVSVLPHAGWTPVNYRIAPAPLTRVLDEGDVVDLGDRQFRVLRLPGHSFGCIGLFGEADGVLFAGDAVYDGKLYDDLWCSNRDDYRQTMRRLIDLDIRVAYCGHGEPLNGERVKQIARGYLERGA